MSPQPCDIWLKDRKSKAWLISSWQEDSGTSLQPRHVFATVKGMMDTIMIGAHWFFTTALWCLCDSQRHEWYYNGSTCHNTTAAWQLCDSQRHDWNRHNRRTEARHYSRVTFVWQSKARGIIGSLLKVFFRYFFPHVFSHELVPPSDPSSNFYLPLVPTVKSYGFQGTDKFHPS